ncbi:MULTISPECIES: hypothetical protein [unclassified Xanthobacter]|uniref:hypothetical protein n=1 Tax=unclassified Xanthobacter TaxID=2623496 RepID=UPI001EE046A4|nr:MULTISPECIES: hypothetical protein [unclassified Xanthobacter]
MRTVTYTALALAASLSLAGIARADDTVTNGNLEARKVSEQSWIEAQQNKASAARLGYTAPASSRVQNVEGIFERGAAKTRDQQFMEEGDRGLGTN